MHTLQDRKKPVVTLYVKAAPFTYNIRAVFEMARSMTPCMLVLEDIDTIVTENTRSYFFNELDGLASNDGLLSMLAVFLWLD
jgi:transitional endoplasmic reticulum ATPase